MAAPPRFKALSREDFRGAPEWFEPLFRLINESLSAIGNALDRRLTRTENLLAAEKVGAELTTRAVLADTWPLTIKNDLPGSVRPKHVWVTQLQRADGVRITDAWSMTWKLNGNGQLELELQGLAVSTSYRLSIAYE